MDAIEKIKIGPQNSQNPIMECIVLAGGLGTRLRSAVSDVPKCMAPVAGKPFLQHLINQLIQQGVTRFIFSLGYLHEVIEQFLINQYPKLNYSVVLEDEPLGTGGAIYLACKKTTQPNVLIVNGDTFYNVDLVPFFQYHFNHHSICTLALKPMTNFDRYGVVEINKDGYIQSFKEKKSYQSGLINGGVYVINVDAFLNENFERKFSFEKEFLEKYFTTLKMMGMIQDKYFIDIGIPEDFDKANNELFLP